MKTERTDRPPTLIVDDEPGMVETLKRLLLASEYPARSVEARSLEEARAKLRESTRFAGFVVDWRLGPGVTSEPLLEDIRRLYPRPHRTPLYVATVAAEERAVVRRAGRYGARVLRKRLGMEWGRAAAELRRGERHVVAVRRWLHERTRPGHIAPRQTLLTLAVIDGARLGEVARALDVETGYVRELARDASATLGVPRLSELVETSPASEA